MMCPWPCLEFSLAIEALQLLEMRMLNDTPLTAHCSESLELALLVARAPSAPTKQSHARWRSRALIMISLLIFIFAIAHVLLLALLNAAARGQLQLQLLHA